LASFLRIFWSSFLFFSSSSASSGNVRTASSYKTEFGLLIRAKGSQAQAEQLAMPAKQFLRLLQYIRQII
jgi:hypothetical protein